ncbi:MAG: hypothetical protein HY744_30790 [Deltaproteobacteria bacterium]|nr:hypothetical protein [Deltaproteobacteria bacterium]
MRQIMLLRAGAAATCLFLALPARAGDPSIPDDDPEQGVPRSRAADVRSGHWLFALGGAVAAPSAELLPRLTALGRLSAGGSLRASVGYGLGRHGVAELGGGATWFPAGADAGDNSSAASYDVGTGLVYHLAQGLALDPWAGYGLGLRHDVAVLPAEERTFLAFDFARLSLGADFYPMPSWGFGPFIETDVGVRAGEARAVYALFHAGLRFAFDPMSAGTNFAPALARR